MDNNGQQPVVPGVQPEPVQPVPPAQPVEPVQPVVPTPPPAAPVGEPQVPAQQPVVGQQ